MKQSHPFALTILLALNLLLGACQPSIRPLPQTRHSETQWNVTASLSLDALVFLNGLTGDPLVGTHYLSEAFDYKSKRSFFCTWFLTGKPETLDNLIKLANHPQVLRQGMIDYDTSPVEMNVYYNQENFPQNGESYQAFLIRMVREGKL